MKETHWNKKLTDWHEQHGKVISEFLKYINDCSGEYVLKGGTALLCCYNLDRFSEDIDLDSNGANVKTSNIAELIKVFCNSKQYDFRTAKNTDTVKRFMINYGNSSHPLKVEISYRKKTVSQNEYTKINGIKVYKIENLCMMKASAYSGRDKIRDLYDLTFICNNYFDKLSDIVKSSVAEVVAFKGIEQFDYLIKEQPDTLIDADKLADDFLTMYDKLGLFTEKKHEDKKFASLIDKALSKETKRTTQKHNQDKER